MVTKKQTAKTKAKATNGNGNGAHVLGEERLPTRAVQIPFDEPRLSSMLPPHTLKRISHDDGITREMLWAVGVCFGYGATDDKRLNIDNDQKRGHHAHRIDPLPGCLARVGDEPRVSLIVLASAVVGEERGQSFVKVADYLLARDDALDAPPVRAVDRFIDPEMTARVKQLLFALPEDEVTVHLSNGERFRETVAERINVDAAIYPLASGSVVLFARYSGLLWAVCRQSAAPYRLADPPPIRTWSGVPL